MAQPVSARLRELSEVEDGLVAVGEATIILAVPLMA
jgi:hypothetical protein